MSGRWLEELDKYITDPDYDALPERTEPDPDRLRDEELDRAYEDLAAAREER